MTWRPLLVLLLAGAVLASGCGKSKAEREADAAKAYAAAEKAKADVEARNAARLEEEARARARLAEEEEKRAKDERLETLKRQVVSMMKDPDSTQFRAVRLAPDAQTLCGEVNSKNSFGGYVGFRPFMVYRGEVLIASPTEGASFDQSLMTMKYVINLRDSGCEVR